MDIETEKKRIKKWIVAYLAVSFIFLIVGLANPLFLILTALFLFIASRMFKDINRLDEENISNVQEIVHSNLDEKQINQEVKMETTNEEKAELLDTLSKDEDVNLFLKVTKGQIKFGLFEKLNKEFEAEVKKPKEEKGKAEAEKGSKGEEEDIIVED